MKQKIFSVGLLVVAVVIIAFSTRERSRPTQTKIVPVIIEEDQKKEKQLVDSAQSIQAETERPSTISTEEIKSFRAALPDQTDAKTEVVQNHHKTPATIINFATILGSLMEKGLSNSADADLLIEELDECLMRENAAESARALCLSHAKRLAKAHPDLKMKVDDMKSSAPTEVIHLLERREQLLKK